MTMLEIVRKQLLEDLQRSNAIAAYAYQHNQPIWQTIIMLYDVYVKDNNVDESDTTMAINVTDGIYNAL